jgi:tetratricopeptide (TPR) repeat protein
MNIDKGCLAVAVVVGMFLAGMAAAQTTASSDTPSKEVKSKAVKSKKSKHPATRKTIVPKQSDKNKQIDAAKAQTKAEQEARLKVEAAAKAEQEARLKAEAEAKAQREAEIAEQEKRIQEAGALVKAGKPGEAYILLEPMEFERSGEVRFDYLLGISALDSGKADKATIAFERVMAVDPNFAGARLDMARAYYQLGDLPRAKTEFEEVLKQNPPEIARATIQKYLAAIDAQMHAKDNHVTGYLEAMVGHDTNVNSSTSQALVPVPALGNVPISLGSASLKTADDYLGVNGGINVLHPVSQTVALFAGADVRQRGNMTQTSFNTTTLNGSVGGIFTLGQQDSLKLGLVDGSYALGSAHYFDNMGLNGEWRHAFSAANQMSVFAQQMNYRFVDSISIDGTPPANMTNQNFDQEMLGANWIHVMKDGKSSVFGSLFLGQEQDTNSRPDGGKNFNGFRVGGQDALNDKTELFANVGWNDGTYTKQDAAFLTTRHDTLTDATIGTNWHWDKLWTLRPQVAWSRNQSNISIYGFDRVDTSVTLRRDFN